ncbi:UDP-N-acetylmuramoyl-tripeptide--D-alanyl-D-alanine ligase [Fructilactobacillus vespulae]|uniref:UDP-N-acetylmuramoyl-tripeptide--D-alanyl-D- alanine ligase n=1 Tax=Fructilactobacillus vespulae TaxID=1249630 RepID=UPI0039B522B2
MKMSLAEINKAVQGKLVNEKDISVTGVSFDSRKLEPGELFVPLVGENDGHRFIKSAIENGAVATFWDANHQDSIPTDIPTIVVKDSLTALQQLAKYYLAKINPQVVAVTGSNGKTTTKDLVAAVAATKFNVTKTQANFNNEIGVPITILSMNSNTEVLVVEMGMDRPGQLDFLSKLVTPDIAIITMIGEAHIEFFKTRGKIADAKLEITNGLRSDGFFIYNGDEPLLNERATPVAAIHKTFGIQPNNDLYSTEIIEEDHETKFKTNQFNGFEFTLNLIGAYNVNNALAAIMVGKILAISPQEMQTGFTHAHLTENRTEWVKGAQQEMILSDVYNSNPTAVRAVLNAFKDTKLTGKRIVVLGDMLELGSDSPKMHADLASSINSNDFKQVFLIGADMQALSTQLKNKYQLGTDLFQYDKNQIAELTSDLQKNINPGDEVLLKASHGIHLEQVLDALKTSQE